MGTPTSTATATAIGSMIKWFADLRRRDTAIAGGKGANLGELTSGGFHVPPGFVITAAGLPAHDGARRRPQ